jgi:hypothetical protein
MLHWRGKLDNALASFLNGEDDDKNGPCHCIPVTRLGALSRFLCGTTPSPDLPIRLMRLIATSTSVGRGTYLRATMSLLSRHLRRFGESDPPEAIETTRGRVTGRWRAGARRSKRRDSVFEPAYSRNRRGRYFCAGCAIVQSSYAQREPRFEAKLVATADD